MEKIKQFAAKNWEWLILAAAMVCFLAIAEDVFEQEIMKIDTISYKIIVGKLRVDWLTKIVNVITNLGGVYILPIICLIALLVLRNKKIGITMSCNLVLISLCNVLLKNIVQRPRPEGYRLIAESGYSFPSGHSMISMAFYGLIIFFIYKYIENKKAKYILCTLLAILILLIGFSRIYLGVHYASDVIAGFLVSIAYLICFITVYNAIIERKKEKVEK